MQGQTTSSISSSAALSPACFLLLLLLFTFSSLFSATALSGDALALLYFKSKTDLQGYLPFNASTSHCRWHGVLCAPGSDKVIRLVIQNINLGGIIPANSLTRLNELRILSLQNDSLTGPIPDLSNLVNLKFLYLTHNSFSGPFPPSVFSLHGIKTVDLSHNNLTGPLPAWLTRLNRLNYLRLDVNRFTGTIPPLNQSTLLTFNVSRNNLTGPVPVTDALVRFRPSSFARNHDLCGKIVHRECRSKLGFFGSSSSPAPTVAAALRPVGELGETEQLGRGKDEFHSRKGVGLILGLSIGALCLVGAVVCFACTIRRVMIRRKKSHHSQHISDEQTVEFNNSRMENPVVEEMEGKVKTVVLELNKTTAGPTLSSAAVVSLAELREECSGDESLVFCSGEDQQHLYTVEQLMRGSAELLGRGCMGTTYKAVMDNRVIVCVKRLDGSRMGAVGKEVFKQHMGTVGGLRHHNLVPLRAYFEGEGERLLVYDYQPNGSLFSLLHGSKSARAKPLHWTSCLKIAEDIAHGLSYIHQARWLVHGNLKSSNVLLGSEFEACLTDYCLTPLANDDDQSNSGPHSDSMGYRAPETRESTATTSAKSDVYSYGILLVELLSGKPPHQQQPYLESATKEVKMNWVRKARESSTTAQKDKDDVEEENKWLDVLLEVAEACSMSSPEQRPTMWHVLKMLQDIKEAMLLEDR